MQQLANARGVLQRDQQRVALGHVVVADHVADDRELALEPVEVLYERVRPEREVVHDEPAPAAALRFLDEKRHTAERRADQVARLSVDRDADAPEILAPRHEPYPKNIW